MRKGKAVKIHLHSNLIFTVLKNNKINLSVTKLRGNMNKFLTLVKYNSLVFFYIETKKKKK